MNEEEFVRKLHKFKGEPARALSFQPSVDLLVDAAHCKDLTLEIHADNARWERMIATPNLGDSLPEKRGLYMFVWRPDFKIQFESVDQQFSWVIYIGKAGTDGGASDTIAHRYRTEYSKFVGGDPSGFWDPAEPQSREVRLTRYLALRPLDYWFLLLLDTKDIALYERRLIKLFRPPLNYQHGPKVKVGKRVPAFEESPSE